MLPCATNQKHIQQGRSVQLVNLKMLKKQTLKTWRYTTTDGQVQWLLAPDSEHAVWAAVELSGGSEYLKDVYLDNDEW